MKPLGRSCPLEFDSKFPMNNSILTYSCVVPDSISHPWQNIQWTLIRDFHEVWDTELKYLSVGSREFAESLKIITDITLSFLLSV